MTASERGALFERRLDLLHDDLACRRALVEFADERIFTRLQWTDIDRRLAPARNHFFAIEPLALEFLGGGILVLHDQLDLLPRRHGDLVGHEAVIADGDLERPVVGNSYAGNGEAAKGEEGAHRELRSGIKGDGMDQVACACDGRPAAALVRQCEATMSPRAVAA